VPAAANLAANGAPVATQEVSTTARFPRTRAPYLVLSAPRMRSAAAAPDIWLTRVRCRTEPSIAGQRLPFWLKKAYGYRSLRRVNSMY
jgi:hypothetical protein